MPRSHPLRAFFARAIFVGDLLRPRPPWEYALQLFFPARHARPRFPLTSLAPLGSAPRDALDAPSWPGP
eukprot:8356335-Pyramimonas_sp.AAC.1